MILNDHRRRIDDLDRELVRLLNRRAQMSIQLGQIKRETGLPLHDEAREEAIVHHAQRLNPGPLDDQALTAIFALILAESRRITSEFLPPAVSGVPEPLRDAQ